MKLKTLTLTAAVFAFVVCGDDSFPPEACVALGDETLHVGESKVVPICFEDPDGDEIAVTVAVSDAAILEAVVQGQTRAIALTARGVGEAVVNVTATDSHGLTAEEIISVTVPNRAPEGRDIPRLTLTDDAPTATLALLDYFSDPDGQPLTFTAEVSDASVLSATVTGDVLTIEQLGSGSAVARVTATDPHGLTAAQIIRVAIRVRTVLLRDDFQTFEGWERSESAVVRIEDGRLRIGTLDPRRFSVIRRRVSSAENWVLSANVGYATDDMWPTFWIATGDSEVEAIVVLFGANLKRLVSENDPGTPTTNIAVAVYFQGSWRTEDRWNALVDGIGGVGQQMEVSVSIDGVSIKIAVDGVQVHEVPVMGSSALFPSTIEFVMLAGWPALGINPDPNDGVYFDWVEAKGITNVSPQQSELALFPWFAPSPITRIQK